MIWNEKIECTTREEMNEIQRQRLVKLVERVYENVPFYRKKMDKMGILPTDIKEIADIQRLPFTTKQDLRDNYPFGLFAVSQQKIVRVHASSGTLRAIQPQSATPSKTSKRGKRWSHDALLWQE